MGFIIVIVLILLAIGLIAANKSRISQTNPDSQPWPFYAKKPLTNPEQILYFRLCQALPGHIVLAQVGLSRLLGVKKGHHAAQWFNRISRMSLDFVICRPDAQVLVAIELDDASHQTVARQAADQKKDQALASAGIRLIRWQVSSIPDLETIKTAILNQPALSGRSD